MNHLLLRRITTTLAGLVVLFAPLASQAAAHSKAREVVVVEPHDLGELAQLHGDSLFLHPDNTGSTYLYVAQNKGGRLSIFDVSDPAKIKLISSNSIPNSGVFDFVRPLGESAELVRYREGNRVAILDLRKPKKPVLQMASAQLDHSSTEPLGLTAFMTIGEPYKYVHAEPRDYKVIDIADPSNPTLLTTVKQVEHSGVNGETGTTFLLGSDGLTVLRRISVENEYKIRQIQMQGN